MHAGAAPATVSGEPLSNEVTEAMRLREGRTAATTREPGDLPRQYIVHGRGVPVCAKQLSLTRYSLHASAMAFAPNYGV